MTSEARPLTRRHRRQQIALRATIMQDLSAVWMDTFDVDDVRRSWAAFHRAAMPVIRDAHGQSSALAQEYFNSFRDAAGAPGRAAASRPKSLDVARARAALEHTSKITTLRGIAAGHSPQQASQVALTRTLGASGRLASEGGRQTIINSVRDDPAARGWQRITGGEPCEFCAMLSARGGVYSRDGADFEAHDHCACEAEPVYGERFLDERQQAFRDLYEREAKGQSEPLKAFRSAYRREFA